MREIPTIRIDMDVDCPFCKKPGAIISDEGMASKCLDCIADGLRRGTKGVTNNLPEYWPAPVEIEKMASSLISNHHPEAANAHICYLFRKKHAKANGKIRLGSCQKQSPKNKLLNGFDYVIEIAWDMWVMLEPLQREALLLHELCHIFKDGEVTPAWKIEPHNVEEFSKVIAVYGLWEPDLEKLAAAIESFENGPGYRQLTFGTAVNQ